MLNIDISSFIKENSLPASFKQTSQAWFLALVDQLAVHQKGASKPLVIGINGAQGSGKSTLAALLVFILNNHFKLNTVTLSLDDFYLTRAARKTLAEQVHPLLLTRGVPGTHDVQLAVDTITRLQSHQLPVYIPRFNKAVDDRYEELDQVTEPVDVILLEGWCMGAEAQAVSALAEPANSLELTEDSGAVWRTYVNTQLVSTYPALFNLIDVWVMLKAPSFDCVFNWRLEQEDKLRKKRVMVGA